MAARHPTRQDAERLNRAMSALSTVRSRNAGTTVSASPRVPRLAATVSTVLCVLYLLANVYDMGGEHTYKYVGSAILVPVALYGLSRLRLSTNEIAGFSALFVVWPIIAYLHGLASGGDPQEGLSETTPFSGVLLALLVASVVGMHRTLRCFHYVILTLAFVIVTITVVSYLGLWPGMATDLPEYVSCHIDPYIGTNKSGELHTRVYFTATLWLVPGAVYFFGMRRFLFGTLCALGLIAAVSKAGAVIALGFSAVVLIRNRTGRILGPVAVAACLLAGAFLFPDFWFDVDDAFSSDSESISIRWDHAESLDDLVTANPLILLTGQGAGTAYYSRGAGASVGRIEVDHLDMLRRYGLPWTLAYCLLYVAVVARLLKSDGAEEKVVGWAFLSIFIAAATNPQLITPMGLFYLGGCYLLSRKPPVKPDQGNSRDPGERARALGAPSEGCRTLPAGAGAYNKGS